MNQSQPHRFIALCCLIATAFLAAPFTSSGLVLSEAERPSELDVRGPDGVPKGTFLRQPTTAQLKALSSLESLAGGLLVVQYNGLTATPRHLFSHSNYLTPPSSAPAETIAREFLNKWRGIWRFSDADLQNLRLKSRATLPDTGTTILLFEQQVDGVSVHKGEVLVNVNRAGQVISAGNENFPQMSVSNSFTLSPAQAVTAGAAGLGLSSFAPQSLGATNVLRTYGDLPHEFVEGTRFSGGEVFSDEIVVSRVIFPLGDEGRAAYKFTLTTPQYEGIMWEHIVDAGTGQVLRRISLTAFQAGGGIGTGRKGTLRPDIQDKVEAFSTATAQGKVFDSMPTMLSGRLGFGRAPNPGDVPSYAPETATVRNSGRGFKLSWALGRTEAPLIYPPTFGQVLRGLPDAQNPTPESPFGWFYLPTDNGGAEIDDTDFFIAATRAFGYTIHPEADARNVPENSPTGDGDQPFSASLTTLPAVQNLVDGRSLSSVFESNYTEGNNVIVSDDHGNDNETTHGIKGFSLGRQFNAGRFDFINSYEFGDVDAAAGVFPSSTFPDIYPGTLNLFWTINLIHDYLYSIGFTEALWNFQQDNFGKGGAGRDAVSGQVQDGSGINNANFGTPSDGSRPRMQMFLWTEAAVRRADGDMDFDVVAHELYHGVSNRSAGKGETGCLGITLVGESGGQGEGWSDYLAESMSDDDATAEYPVGEFDVGIRRLPKTNFRFSYGSINQRGLTRRDQQPPDVDTGTGTPFAVHRTGEVWSATLWDMREMLIMKDPNAVFFDGTRRLGNGTNFFIGSRQVKSIDTRHPIDYRSTFNTNDAATVIPAQHVVRPGLVANEIATLGHRSGPLATAVRNGARLADTLVLRGLQLCPCNPSYVDSRNSILMADRELTGGENQAVIWRAFASHGVGAAASSTAGSGDDPVTQKAPIVVEDFTVPVGVTQCEQLGPLPAPGFSLANVTPNEVTVTIGPVTGAVTYVISRANSPTAPFNKIAEIPAAQTVYTDNNGGQGLVPSATYRYQVRATRNSDCVSTANTQTITITTGIPLMPAPLFFGITQVDDPKAGDRLILSWRPATSVNPAANLVYDIFRVAHVTHGTGQANPTFAPSVANRIAEGLAGTSYVDTGRVLNQVYYYIVQARDLQNGKKDTNNIGNTLARWSAPTIPCFTGPTPFAPETFESATANTRFAPPLVDSGTDPNENAPAFQRVTGVNLGPVITGMMYGPSYSPPDQDGGPSDFPAVIGPLTLTPTSIMEFDHLFSSEANFDGGVLEVSVGSPNFNAQVFPDNVTTFDLGDYMIEGGYNDKLNGELAGVMLSALQGRRAFTGFKGLHHTRIALKNFAAGGVHNLAGAPVYIRFRMTSDSGTSVGPDSGWYIDNVSIKTMGASGSVEPPQVVSRKTHDQSGTFDIPMPLTGPRGIECRSGGANGDHTLVFTFTAPLTSVGGASVSGGTGSVSSSGIDANAHEYVVNLTGVTNAQVVTVTLTGVNDTCGNSTASLSVPIGVLLGDVNSSRVVTGADVNLVKQQQSVPVTNGNFRTDINASGVITGADVNLVRQKQSTFLP